MTSPRLLYRRIAGLISVVSITALCFQIVAPELYLAAQSKAEGSGDVYIYVTRDNNLGETSVGSCTLFTNFPPSAGQSDIPCSLNQAIAFVNTLNPATVTQTVNIRIKPSLPILNLAQNTPAITFRGAVNIDGQGTSTATKTVLRDGTVDSGTLDHFFLLNVPDPQALDQRLTIQNFAFTALRKSSANAITTDQINILTPPDANGVRSNLEGTYATNLNILNNYFGTTDGNTIVAQNALAGSIQLNIFRSGNFAPQVSIQGNNIFNTTRGIFLGMGESPANTSCEVTYNTRFVVQNNTIGVASDGTAPAPTVFSSAGWLGSAIEVCGAAGVTILSNTIANSAKTLITLNTINTAIKLLRSSGKIQNNFIGTSNASTGLSNEAAQIIGNGIMIIGRLSDNQKTFITDNRIHNLTLPTFPNACINPLQRYSPRSETTSVCGGTGILIEGSNNNWIYNNRIGSPSMPNRGYGISIEGQLTSNEPVETDTFNPENRNYDSSYNNIISGNSISYNGADGIHINTITDLDPSEITNGQCDFTASTHHNSNNCYNTVTGNRIFRNGAYSGASQGGIGIDLKGTNEREQNSTTTPTAATGGTNNDIDITTGTSSFGANGLLPPPSIYGDGSSLLRETTANEIRGYLGSSYPQGRYWVEVFKVQCHNGYTTDNFTQLTLECDTDSPSSTTQAANQSYGQGSEFVCGALVNKTGGNTVDWSCQPSDFGNPNVSGLITATITQAPLVSLPYLYHEDGAGAFDPVPPTANFGIPTTRYSCELIESVFQGTNPCTGITGASTPLNTFGTMSVAATLDNTSEFSRNAYIPGPTFEVSKTAAVCSSSEVSCEDDFGTALVDVHGGEELDYRIVVTNTSSASPISIQLTDTVPADLEILDCEYQNHITVANPIRTNLTLADSQTCFGLGSPTIVSFSEIGPGEKAVIFMRTRITPSFIGTLTNTATAIDPDSGVAKESTLAITLEENIVVPSLTLSKTIVGADDNRTLTETNFEIAGSDTTHLVHYQITATATGYDSATVANLSLTDNFPRASGITYETCSYSVTINGSTSANDCVPASDINTGGDTPIEIFTGSTILAADSTIATSDIIEVLISYDARIPVNAVATTAPLNNVATWGDRDAPGDERHFSSASLTVTDATTVPEGPGGSPFITKQIRSCSSNTTASCSSNTFVDSLTNVAPGSTVEYRLEVTHDTSTNDNIVTIQDLQPAGITFVSNSCIYTNTQSTALSNTGARVGSRDCTFSGSNILITTTIGAGDFAYVYVLATVNSTSSGTIANIAQLTAGCDEGTKRCLDAASLTVAAANPSSITMTKTVSTPSGITLGTSNQTVTYTVRLTKPAGTALSNIVWVDSFPNTAAGSTPLVTYNNCQSSVSTIVCSSNFGTGTNFVNGGGSIAADVTSVTITYNATIQGGTVSSNQTLHNVVQLKAPEVERTASADLLIRSSSSSGTAVPSFTKRANNNVTSASRTTETIYKPGDTVSYTISLSNSGSAPAASVAISDTLPGNLSTPTIDTVTGLVASIANRVITSTPFTLATGTNRASIVYHATLADRTDYDLSDADLDTEADPTDDDFFIDDNAEIDADIASRGNTHRDEDDLVGAPDGKPLSLGDDGSVIIDLGDKLIVNGTGNDFGVVALTRLADNTDGDTSRYQVSVSQDGVTFTNIGDDDNTETQHFDLRRVRLPWIKFIQITDKSSSVKGSAPGADIDAVCLFNIGVEEINQAALTYNGTTLRTAAPIVVDVTSTFDDEPDSDNCAEQEITLVSDYIPPLLPPPGSLANPPRDTIPRASSNTSNTNNSGTTNSSQTPTVTRAPVLPKTGPGLTALLALGSSVVWWRLRKKK